jgi:hypothetical protein
MNTLASHLLRGRATRPAVVGLSQMAGTLSRVGPPTSEASLPWTTSQPSGTTDTTRP